METVIKWIPHCPMLVRIASCTNGIPSNTPLSPCTPEIKSIIAVVLQIKSVSMKTEITCTSPCLTGWSTSADAAAFGALPIPASFENSPLLIPIITALPANPPAKERALNAFSKIIPNTCGILLIFVSMV